MANRMKTALDVITDVSHSGKDPKHSIRALNIAGTGYKSPRTIMRIGEAYRLHSLNFRTPFNYTTPVGVMSGLIMSYFFYLGKRGFGEKHKMIDWLEISPVHAQYYQITVQQKQQLERQIKEGLASITQAVGDLELLLHDLRRYAEYMDYFEKLAKGEVLIKAGKKEEGTEMKTEAEQTLKAVFIDQVDIHTDLPQTPIAMRSIVGRWPTIIADFMRLEDKDKDPKKIAKKLEVSEAEGVVLATKNKLYQEWRETFKKTVKDRYKRILGLVEARKKSVNEYKNMLRPYVNRYRSIREFGETPEGREALEKHAFYRHAAQAVSVDYSMTWLWRCFRPPDFFKIGLEAEVRKVNVLKSRIYKGFKKMAKENWSLLKEKGLTEVSLSTTGVEPLDKFVYYSYPYIEEHYNVDLDIADILQIRENFCEKNYDYPYFETMEVGWTRAVIRLADGTEFEDVVLDPFWCYMDTQNIIILRMLEVLAKQREEESFLMQMLGEMSEEGKKIKDLMEEAYPHIHERGEIKEKEKKKEEAEVAAKVKKATRSIGKFLGEIGFPTDVRFFKPGPYETHVEDVITGIWVPEFLSSIQIPSNNFFKDALGIPGVKAAYR